jgi:hypothetical protein
MKEKQLLIEDFMLAFEHSKINDLFSLMVELLPVSTY